jgi:hypothetical protein
MKSVVPPPDDDEQEQMGDAPMGHTPYTPLGTDNDKPGKEAVAELMEQTPLIRQVLGHIDQKIKLLEKSTNISDETLTNPEKFMHVVAGRKVAIATLEKERDYLQRKVKQVVSKQ